MDLLADILIKGAWFLVLIGAVMIAIPLFCMAVAGVLSVLLRLLRRLQAFVEGRDLQ